MRKVIVEEGALNLTFKSGPGAVMERIEKACGGEVKFLSLKTTPMSRQLYRLDGGRFRIKSLVNLGWNPLYGFKGGRRYAQVVFEGQISAKGSGSCLVGNFVKRGAFWAKAVVSTVAAILIAMFYFITHNGLASTFFVLVACAIWFPAESGPDDPKVVAAKEDILGLLKQF